MAWDGNGNFSRIHNWASDRDAGIKITASRHDAEDDNLTTGIGACLTKNNETKPTADFRPNATRLYSLGSTALRWITAFISESIKFRSATASFDTILAATDATVSDKTITLPNATGTVVLTTTLDTFLKTVVKSANESVTSSTTLQDDDHLVFAIGANEQWVATYSISMSTAGPPGCRFAITVPAGATMEASGAVEGKSGGRTATSGTAFINDATNATANPIATIRVWVSNGATAGNVTLQWAQGTSDASSLTLLTGSFLLARKV